MKVNVIAEKKKRSVTWIFYVIVLGLTIPLILIFTWYQVKLVSLITYIIKRVIHVASQGRIMKFSKGVPGDHLLSYATLSTNIVSQ